MLRRQRRLELWQLDWLDAVHVWVGDTEQDTIGLLFGQLRRNMRDKGISGGDAEPSMLRRQRRLELWQLDWLVAVDVWVGDTEQDTIGLLFGQLRRNVRDQGISGGDAEPTLLQGRCVSPVWAVVKLAACWVWQRAPNALAHRHLCSHLRGHVWPSGLLGSDPSPRLLRG